MTMSATVAVPVPTLQAHFRSLYRQYSRLTKRIRQQVGWRVAKIIRQMVQTEFRKIPNNKKASQATENNNFNKNKNSNQQSPKTRDTNTDLNPEPAQPQLTSYAHLTPSLLLTSLNTYSFIEQSIESAVHRQFLRSAAELIHARNQLKMVNDTGIYAAHRYQKKHQKKLEQRIGSRFHFGVIDELLATHATSPMSIGGFIEHIPADTIRSTRVYADRDIQQRLQMIAESLNIHLPPFTKLKIEDDDKR